MLPRHIAIFDSSGRHLGKDPTGPFPIPRQTRSAAATTIRPILYFLRRLLLREAIALLHAPNQLLAPALDFLHVVVCQFSPIPPSSFPYRSSTRPEYDPNSLHLLLIAMRPERTAPHNENGPDCERFHAFAARCIRSRQVPATAKNIGLALYRFFCAGSSNAPKQSARARRCAQRGHKMAIPKYDHGFTSTAARHAPNSIRFG